MTENLPSHIAVVGLGYVGLPLATAFSGVLPTIGFDINKDRIRELRNGSDRNGEVDQAALFISETHFGTDAIYKSARNGGRPSALVDVDRVMPQMKCKKELLYWSL